MEKPSLVYSVGQSWLKHSQHRHTGFTLGSGALVTLKGEASMTKDNPKDSGSDEGIQQPARESEEEIYVLRLYVSGTTSKSTRAIENLRQLCETELSGRYNLQVIDVYQKPSLAKEAQIVALPTLVKESPPPLRKLVGDLSDTEHVLSGLDLRPKR